jgi:hypothetical protein
VEQQYAAQASVPQARQRAHQPQRQQVAEPIPNYKPYDNAPPQIQQLLQFQQQIPYLNVIPEQYRYQNDSSRVICLLSSSSSAFIELNLLN